ncbi:MAG: nucleotidyltransferase domain-containing protein [Burkholderiales bacterium]|nr:nucleotidyltransferase domain-containing protein [Burkholderiales bacterium]
MARDRGRNDERSRIAHLAARLMAEDGIENYALAKRKAARQAGMPDSRQLPTNDEIDAALRAYQQLYHEDEQRDRLRALRTKALKAMRELAQFNPYLTGSVLNGNAGKYADIDLQLFTDNAKAVELYLIDRRIPYKTTQSRLYSGEEPRTFPVFTVNDDGTDILLTVLATHDLRVALRTSPGGKAIDRAKLQSVEILLAET